MKKKKSPLEKQARRLLSKSVNIIVSEGIEHDKVCKLVDMVADLLLVARASDIDPTKPAEEIMKYMEDTGHLILHGLFVTGMQYEKDINNRKLPDSSPGSFDDISINDILKGLDDNG